MVAIAADLPHGPSVGTKEALVLCGVARSMAGGADTGRRLVEPSPAKSHACRADAPSAQLAASDEELIESAREPNTFRSSRMAI